MSLIVFQNRWLLGRLPSSLEDGEELKASVAYKDKTPIFGDCNMTAIVSSLQTACVGILDPSFTGCALWASFLPSLDFSFLVCKMGIIRILASGVFMN